METPRLEPAEPQILSPCNSGRRSSDSNSHDFEFWMVRNPSFPQPNLLSADELFVNGCLLPLHLLHLLHNSDDPPDLHPQPPNQETTTTNLEPTPEAEASSGPELLTAAPDSSTTALTASKRWKDIFKRRERKGSAGNKNEDKEKDKKKDRKSSAGSGANSAELNINIWPFSRSRSAGNNGNRPRMVAGSAATRKVSSAPCSRSNSAGESKSRKWPASPSRGGVHLGRSSPVWQVRRGGSSGRNCAEKGVKKEGNEARRNKTAAAGGGGVAKAGLLNLKVPMCIGYRHHLSCRSDEKTAVGVETGGGGNNVGGHESGGVGAATGGVDGGRGES
ncbi:hypothetical protein F0562_018834 [Nyssa sinensis]|uniref:Uncharacterized protein n=1 Tax=Nyssa sinensis TaxID=561372 RepID=A0A5J4ZAD7_9ASTE|nr:hypothetical protein F0562_018834 [Nyssa sinensis]